MNAHLSESIMQSLESMAALDFDCYEHNDVLLVDRGIPNYSDGERYYSVGKSLHGLPLSVLRSAARKAHKRCVLPE